MLRRDRRAMRRVFSIIGGAVGSLLVLGALAAPAQAVDGETEDILPVDALSPEEADAIIEEFNRTGLVEGSEAPTVRNDFRAEAPSQVFDLANALRERFDGSEGYGPVQWDKESGEVRVWWYGDVPAEVLNLADETSSEAGVRVTLSEMTYSGTQLATAAQQILESRAAQDFDIQSVTALFDGSGLEVASAASASVRRALPDVITSDQLGATESFPVSVVETGEVQPANNRQSGQVAPYAGGARIYFTGGGGCSSAFGVMITNPREDRNKPRGMLTAHHCGNYGPGNWVTPSSAFFGYKTSEYASVHRDAAVMVNSPGVSGVPDTYPIYYPMMYVGAWNAGSRYIVVNGQTPVIGADWCTSGSYSGTFCYNEIVQTNVYANYGSPATNVGPLVETYNYNNFYAVGQGDSGGPAYRYVDATSNGVFATGIISGIRNAGTTCEGYQYTDRLCSKTALISPIYPAMANMDGGLTLMTNTNY